VTKTGTKWQSFLFAIASIANRDLATTISGMRLVPRLAACGCSWQLLTCIHGTGGNMSALDWLRILDGFRYCLRWSVLVFNRFSAARTR
jgi:hypothetical protein